MTHCEGDQGGVDPPHPLFAAPVEAPMPFCEFCRVAQDDQQESLRVVPGFVAIPDRRPKAKTHYLVMPRKHIESLLQHDDDPVLLSRLVAAVAATAKRLRLPGYKVVLNVGRRGGQRVMHLHAHILSDYASG